MVLGAKTWTSVVAPTRRDGRLVIGVDAGTVTGSKRDMEGLAWLALADPEVGRAFGNLLPP